MANLLLIDDRPALIVKQIRRVFPPPLHSVEVATTGTKGIERVRAMRPDIVLLDLRLPDMSGLAVHQAIRKFDVRIPVIFITVAMSADSTIEAMKQGASDYLFKPLDIEQLERVVSNALVVAGKMRGSVVISPSNQETDIDGGLIGTCAAMREVYKQIGLVAAQNVPVLITGESGTGKELVARAVYQHGPRASAPFLALNCAGIPDTLQESELFGHEKGAFTGADRRHIGKFEQCTGGTIFLDEIGDMPLSLQAKVLRLLQDQTFERVGGNETIQTDVRLLAATHRDLKARSEDGSFRLDLYYRLNVYTIHLPPLRERGDDLVTLVQFYVHRFSTELGRHVGEVSAKVMERLKAYDWPGNVRELQSVLKRSVLQTNGSVLLPEFLSGELPEQATSGKGDKPSRRTDGGTLDEMERDAIQRCLQQNRGNRQQTAKHLGISTRTLLRKIRRYDLVTPQATVAPEKDDDTIKEAES